MLPNRIVITSYQYHIKSIRNYFYFRSNFLFFPCLQFFNDGIKLCTTSNFCSNKGPDCLGLLVHVFVHGYDCFDAFTKLIDAYLNWSV